MHVDRFAGLADSELIERFTQARAREYEEIDAQAAALEKSLQAKKRTVSPETIQEAVGRLRRRYLEIARVDYFSCSLAGPLAARLDAIERAAAPHSDPSGRVTAATLAEFRGKHWVTRPRPHVDRLACVWLIRRFIDPHAAIRYANHPEPDEIAFDISGALFEHEGNHCTFETLLEAFKLDEPALHVMAEMVHEIDLRDGQYDRPGTAGVDEVLSGWLLTNFSDVDLETYGIALFEGLYLTLSTRSAPKVPDQKLKRRQK
jgi:hypothetical protein